MTVLYPFDPTGMAADNLVIEESHAVTEAHYRDYHFLIPDFAPFYADGLVIRLAGSDPDQILVAGVDYFEVLPYLGATRSIGKPVYGAIALNSRWTSGVLLLSYQTVGGKWVADRAHVYRALAEKAYNPRTCTWDVLTNVTDQFPPINHTQNFSDYYDEGDLIKAIGRLGTNIAEEADKVPVIRHLRNFENPHRVNLDQLGIPLVGNWRMASSDEALDGLADDILINPKTLAAVRHAITVEWQRQHHNSRRYINHIADLLQHHQDDKGNPHQVTLDQLGIPLVGNWAMADDTQVFSTELTDVIVNPAMLSLVIDAAKTKATEDLTAAVNTLNDTLATLTNALTAHREDKENPHGVTTTQLGIGKIGNWAMATVDEVTAGNAEDVLLNPARLAEVVAKITDAYTLLNTKTNEALVTHAENKDNPHVVTKDQIGLANVGNWAMATVDEVTAGNAEDVLLNPARLSEVVAKITDAYTLLNKTTNEALVAHAENKDNPHVITKDQIGLANVGNWAMATSDEVARGLAEDVLINPARLNEVSVKTTRAYTSLNKITNDALIAHQGDTNNPHKVSKEQVGLGLVENLAMASDMEVVNGDPLNKYVTLRQIVQYLSARGGLLHSIIPDRFDLLEGKTLNFTLTTARLTSVKIFYWSITHGTTTASNFIQNSGTVSIVDNAATIQIQATLRPEPEPDRTFSLVIRETDVNGRIVAVSDPVTLLNVTLAPNYNLVAAHSVVSLSTSNEMALTLNVTNISSGTTLYWEIAHETTLPENFILNAGSFILTGSSYTWSVTAYPSMASRYISAFRIRLRKDAVDSPVVYESDVYRFEGLLSIEAAATAASLYEPGVGVLASTYYVTSTYAPKRLTANTPAAFGHLVRSATSSRKIKNTALATVNFTLTSAYPSINEGDSLSLTVHSDRPIGAFMYYWAIIHTGSTTNVDFSAVSGSFAFVGSQGQFSITSLYRAYDDPDRSFKVAVYAHPTDTTPIATSNAIGLINIAAASLYKITPSSLTVMSKMTKNLSVSVKTAPLDVNTSLMWQVVHITSIPSDFTATLGVVAIVGHAGQFTLSLSPTVTRLPSVTFRLLLKDYASPTPIVTSAIVTIVSELQAVAVMAIDDPYHPLLTHNARTYYWVGNVGRRIERSHSDIVHTYALTTNKSVVLEGEVVHAQMVATEYYGAVTMYWTIRNVTTTAADFVATHGSFVAMNGTGGFDITTTYSTVNDPDKQFYIDVRIYDDAAASVVASSTALTVRNIMYYDPTYSVTATTVSYNAALTRTVSFTVTTTHATDQTYTWKLIPVFGVGNAGYNLVLGSVTTVGNTATITIQLMDPILAYASSTFKIELLQGTTHLAYSPDITVISPTYAVSSTATILDEGAIWPLMLNTTNLPTNTTLYWTVTLGTATASSFKTLSGSVVVSSNATSFSIATVLNKTKGPDKTFSVAIRKDGATGAIIATSGTLTLRDVVITKFDTQWIMGGYLYDVRPPIVAADYYVVHPQTTLRR